MKSKYQKRIEAIERLRISLEAWREATQTKGTLRKIKNLEEIISNTEKRISER